MSFRVGLSHDFRDDREATAWGDIGLHLLDRPDVDWAFLDPDDGVLSARHVAGYDAVVFAAPAVVAETVSGSRPPRLLARFGVGLDSVDVAACTRAGVGVTITPDGARRPVATAALALILATLHRLVAKDALARRPDWSGRLSLRGRGLTGSRVGVLGLGNIAAELFVLLAPFGTTHLAHDPFRSVQDAAALGVELVGLPELFATSDVVVVAAALTEATAGLVGADLIALMRPHAVLVNISRGGIVDTQALTQALVDRRILGAGLDVVEPEPLPPGHPLTLLPNVVLAPHALAWTDELALGNGTSAITAALDLLAGRVPTHLVNRDVVDDPRFGLRAGA